MIQSLSLIFTAIFSCFNTMDFFNHILFAYIFVYIIRAWMKCVYVCVVQFSVQKLKPRELTTQNWFLTFKRMCGPPGCLDSQPSRWSYPLKTQAVGWPMCICTASPRMLQQSEGSKTRARTRGGCAQQHGIWCRSHCAGSPYM